ncbi:hypothetical protein SAMN05443635_11660 [Roseobacter denitrificans OCh 114]|nr:hypothetical protein SAMN05443635_11660 [Roseobacter denitrificans OCh 114]
MSNVKRTLLFGSIILALVMFAKSQIDPHLQRSYLLSSIPDDVKVLEEVAFLDGGHCIYAEFSVVGPAAPPNFHRKERLRNYGSSPSYDNLKAQLQVNEWRSGTIKNTSISNALISLGSNGQRIFEKCMLVKGDFSDRTVLTVEDRLKRRNFSRVISDEITLIQSREWVLFYGYGLWAYYDGPEARLIYIGQPLGWWG